MSPARGAAFLPPRSRIPTRAERPGDAVVAVARQGTGGTGGSGGTGGTGGTSGTGGTGGSSGTAGSGGTSGSGGTGGTGGTAGSGGTGGSAVRRGERGAAVVEVLLLGIPLLAPLVYCAVAVAVAQQAAAGVTEAARQAGRAYVTGTAATAPARAAAAARAVLGAGARIRYTAAHSGCGTATATAWPLRPGVVFAVCVTATLDLPYVPGGPRDVTGRFVVRAADHRDYG